MRHWIERETGSPVVATRRLQGASSAAIHRITLATGAPVVLRRYVWPGFIAAEPDAPARELDAVRFAARHGLPVAHILAADLTGGAIGDGVPAILMSLVPGAPRHDPDVDRLAEVAATIHEVDATHLGHEYFPWYEEEMTTPPPAAVDRALWERAIAIWRTEMPRYPAVFIHRDFHPGNVLWSRHRVSGVVDWANACRGPAGCDLATCWSNLVDWAGRPSADAFVKAYERVTATELDPFWLMANLLEAGQAHWTKRNIRTGERELARLLAELRG